MGPVEGRRSGTGSFALSQLSCEELLHGCQTCLHSRRSLHPQGPSPFATSPTCGPPRSSFQLVTPRCRDGLAPFTRNAWGCKAGIGSHPATCLAKKEPPTWCAIEGLALAGIGCGPLQRLTHLHRPAPQGVEPTRLAELNCASSH